MGRQMINKVPQVTIFFWIITVTAATLGERASDFLRNNLNFGLTKTTLLMTTFLFISIYFQFRAKKYMPRIYWLVVVLMSVVGTLGSDILDITRATKMIIFVALMTVTFLLWYLSERTLSINSIKTRKREAFYWFVVLFAFALGTATGDWISEMLSLNYFSSALMFAAVIGIVTLAYQDYKLNSVLAYWSTYILISPFGKSLNDFLSKPFNSGGLGLGTTGTNILFLLTVVILVIYLTKARKEENGMKGIG